MIDDRGHGARRTVLVVAALAALACSMAADAAVKPRAIIVLPFDASSLGRDDQWIGEGVAQLVSFGLAQHPAFVQIERSRLRTFGDPEVWGDAVVAQDRKSVV